MSQWCHRGVRRCHGGVTWCHGVSRVSRRCYRVSRCHIGVTVSRRCQHGVTACHRVSPRCHMVSRKCHRGVTWCHGRVTSWCHGRVTTCNMDMVSRRCHIDVTRCHRGVTRCRGVSSGVNIGSTRRHVDISWRGWGVQRAGGCSELGGHVTETIGHVCHGAYGRLQGCKAAQAVHDCCAVPRAVTAGHGPAAEPLYAGGRPKSRRGLARRTACADDGRHAAWPGFVVPHLRVRPPRTD